MCVCVTLTRVAAVQECGGTAASGQEGQCRGHEPLHDAALPWAQTQATSCQERALLVTTHNTLEYLILIQTNMPAEFSKHFGL